MLSDQGIHCLQKQFSHLSVGISKSQPYVPKMDEPESYKFCILSLSLFLSLSLSGMLFLFTLMQI